MAKGSDLLLAYAVSTAPSPIQIGTNLTAASARVNFNVSAVTTAYCDQVLLALPVGANIDDLFASPPSGSLSTNKWALTTVNKHASALGLPGDITYTVFTYDCIARSDYLINYDLNFAAFGVVTNVLGNCTVKIQERSGVTDDPLTFTVKNGDIVLAKAPPQFYLKNFIATSMLSPTVPATDFPRRTEIQLKWESNGTYFQIFLQSQSAPIYAGTVPNFTLRAGVTRDATFILVAALTGDPGQGSPSSGYEPVYLYDSLTITIANPDLTPNTIRVASDTTVGGTLSVSGSATISGQANLGAANVDGSLAVAHDLNVNGNTILNGAGIHGDLQVAATTTTSGLAVSGNLTASGPATFNRGLTVTGDAVRVPSISVGSWSFTTNPSGDLTISNGGHSLVFTTGGVLLVDNVRMIKDQDPVRIFQVSKSAWLDWTQKISGRGATNFSGAAYWTTGNDPDSQLKIFYGS
jgi:hypothetical protein